MVAYRISPIGYDPTIVSVMIYKDNEGNYKLWVIRGWIEINEEQYNTIKDIAQNDDEHFEITQIL